MEESSHIQELINTISFQDNEVDRVAMDRVVEAARALGNPRQAVPLMLRWIEKNGHLDLGSPGPFVHFIEEKMDYLPELEASLSSKPTCMTVWMANRIANAETDPVKINHWIGIFERVLSHPESDEQCRDDAHSFISHQSDRLEV
ncbi:hypothetical protein J2X02_003808 [Pseudoxanthomonas japonensis]|uniref:hypothetical protein n=1 Tax=Pseudoxanthomonas japonensis TaxID=69284 RepID=UPI00285DED0B|nr:hypothetical protein [Pseudoxanthomonas japonensis]MDR7070936.1 hypothetical protein [Pseudoxanthomonas japonensis]